MNIREKNCIVDIEFKEYVFYSTFNNKAWGVRKVTTGITGLWQPSDHSDVAF